MAKTKAQLKDELKELNIEFDENATNAELSALVDGAGEIVPDEPEEAPEDELDAPEEELDEGAEDDNPEGVTVDVVSVKSGEIHKTFYKEHHGDDYREIAKEWCGFEKNLDNEGKPLYEVV